MATTCSTAATTSSAPGRRLLSPRRARVTTSSTRASRTRGTRTAGWWCAQTPTSTASPTSRAGRSRSATAPGRPRCCCSPSTAQGWPWSDIVPVDAGVDAAGLLIDGDVDAWVGSYPSLSAVEEHTRTLVQTEGLFSHRSLWFTRRDFATDHPDQLKAIVAALDESDAWITQNYREAAELFAADDGGSVEAWEHALRRRPWGVRPVSPEFVAEQQRAADLFHEAGLISKKITVADAVIEI
ncbi:hypothetical protein [Nonomuraea dietziae]|uniref:hypothetical protein n=1 Tax=Nonomuraea dietziae TaxID=65515 RepID=UPI0031D4AA27